MKIRDPSEFRRFSVARVGLNFEVIDRDGRPMSGELSELDASLFRDKLNTATYISRTRLDTALGAGSPLQELSL